MKAKLLVGLTALVVGCASPDWKKVNIDFNCIDYANAYSRGLVSRGYECGTADYTKDCGIPHRIVWIKDGDTYIYVEPFWKKKAEISKTERTTLRNHIRKGWLENDLYQGTKELRDL